jgi:ATP-dependent RNA helicase DeaD
MTEDRRFGTARPRDDQRGAERRAGTRGDGQGITRIFVGAGRLAGVRPADLVGAITNEAGITSREVGAIQIADRFSLVEVPNEVAEQVLTAMRRATLRGQTVMVRRDRDSG